MKSLFMRMRLALRKTWTHLLPFVIGLAVLSSCGGGSDSLPQVPNQSDRPNNAIFTLSTTVIGTLPPDTTINSYVAVVTLPAGVTVKTVQNTSLTAAGVVVAAGKAVGALVNGVYTAAAGSVPGSVKIFVASGAGFDAGDFCTVNANISPGYYPSETDIDPPTLEDATGFNGNSTVTGLEKELSISASVVIR